MAKIKFNKWKDSVSFDKVFSGYRIGGMKWWNESSAHGKSTATAVCPCCNAETKVYLWSFSGCGKRCSGCNVLLDTIGAFVSNSEITSEVSIDHTRIFKSDLQPKK